MNWNIAIPCQVNDKFYRMFALVGYIVETLHVSPALREGSHCVGRVSRLEACGVFPTTGDWR
ncbi:hypothetical protein SD80_007210 [Scytonema tolypothrichoides VB-61278]|nr:hypothetical protein SD80_007210 [Scytonema tolypothrichoides VB-61278]